MMSVLQITKDNFQELVLESKVPVLLDFWATWCMPCRMLSPTIDRIGAEHPELRVGKVNVDEEPELAAQFRIMSIPALVVMKDGQAVSQSVGVRPMDQILAMVEE